MLDTNQENMDEILESNQERSSSNNELKKNTDDSKQEPFNNESVKNGKEKKLNHNNKLETSIDNEETEIKERLLIAKNEAKKNFDLMLRSKAEFENYKKRIACEMDDLRKYATESLIKELLTVVDNLERAIDSSNNDDVNVKSIIEGINLTLNETNKILCNHNVSPIKSMGELFDPKIHQAMSQEETSKYPNNTVIREFLKGYLLHGRLLRPAMVVVSKEPSMKKD